ncbi:hypothetical protein M3Y94_00828800 [Aphelenchoides besseyi]|nr:hypothetical protein M3Y94_00828800 [Aphelenchoides besseyi]KAI6227040.1 hypothetical protein M3Y95_00684900 [Aphelenchoides besseyi]
MYGRVLISLVAISLFFSTIDSYHLPPPADEEMNSISMEELAESLSSAARAEGGFAGVQAPYVNAVDRRENNKFLLWAADDQNARRYPSRYDSRTRRDLTGFRYLPSRG